MALNTLVIFKLSISVRNGIIDFSPINFIAVPRASAELSRTVGSKTNDFGGNNINKCMLHMYVHILVHSTMYLKIYLVHLRFSKVHQYKPLIAFYLKLVVEYVKNILLNKQPFLLLLQDFCSLMQQVYLLV